MQNLNKMVPVPELKKGILGTGTEINIKAFTLVELIVVITILAILGTIGFMSFQNYNTYARDTIRKSDLSLISRGIKIKQVEGGSAPKPANFVEIYASGSLIGYQGEFTSKIGNRYKLNGDFIDPLDGLNYVYSVDKNLNNFTIGGFLESDEVSFITHPNPLLKIKGIIGKESYAKEGRTLTINGDKFGIILKDGEAINENTGFSGNKLDIMSGSLDSSYELFLDNNEILTGTGLISQNPIASCKRILELGNYKRGDKKNGIYTINPTGESEFEVYCDMTTDGGGWTRYLNIKGNYSFADAKNCLLGTKINNGLIECFNPNYSKMSAKQLMSKVGNNIEKFDLTDNNYSFSTNASLGRPHEEPQDGYKCKGHKDYMVGLYYTHDDENFLEDPSNNYGRIRLGKSRCYYGNTFGGRYSNRYLNSPGINTQGNWEYSVQRGEIYIR